MLTINPFESFSAKNLYPGAEHAMNYFVNNLFQQ